MKSKEKNDGGKKSYKRFFLKDFDEDMSEDKKLFEDKNFSLTKELITLPSKLSNVNICNDESNTGSKSTRATSKKTHPKFHFKINNNKNKIDNFEIKEETNLIETKILDDKNIQPKRENKIDNILSKLNVNLKEEENPSNNIIRFDLLKTLNKSTKEKVNISEKTKSIIEQIKNKRLLTKEINEEKKDDKNDIEFSLLNSLSFKYEELVKKPRELPIPLKYKKIYEMYSSLENFISLSKLNRKSNTLTNFREYIKNIRNINFTIYNLKQILYIAPHFFIIKYITINNQNESIFTIDDKLFKNKDILIDIPKNYKELLYKKFGDNFNFLSLFFYPEDSKYYDPISNSLDQKSLKERNNVFRNLLILIVKKYHDSFLFKKKIILPFDPIIEKTWHHEFNLEQECEDIPILEFPPPKEKIPVFESKIKQIDTTNNIFRDAIEKTLSMNSKIINDNKYKYVSKEFLDKLKRKEEINQITNEVNQINREENKKNDICNFYSEMLLQIKTILLVNKNSLSLNNFANALFNSSSLIKNTIDSINHLANILNELSKIYSDLFSIEHNSIIGKVVVLHNKQFKIPSKEEIKQVLYKIN